MFLRFLVLCAVFALELTWGQNDPGARPGPAQAGRPLQGLNTNELAAFMQGGGRFREIDSVGGTQPGARGSGLGPRFNLNSCGGCHAQPAVGGTSPAENPQIAMATAFGAQNNIPAFIQQAGPVRAVRFARNPDGSPDGGVHNLFTITGRSDAGDCNIQQPNFEAAVAQNNAFFRIPTPVFGAGLIEAIPDSAILANRTANGQAKGRLGIQGHENRSGNDGTITRYGWKAQNKSLLMFAGEAYNVEQGVTNEIFPTERDETPGCALNATPEDRPDPNGPAPVTDTTAAAAFMRFLDAPQAGPETPSIAQGRQQFVSIGCALCHVGSMTTGNAVSPALSGKPVALYSDLLVHRMGNNLNDNIQQGQARGNEWRTAPLWGLGQRLFFLHDGRTSDLMEAIQQHSGQGSEANAVFGAFDALTVESKQDILNFLRSL
jgi:CxxC motif-containing protein (DUF1111 family)